MISTFSTKKSFIEKQFPEPVLPLHSVYLNYYGVNLKLDTPSTSFADKISTFHPESWKIDKNNARYEFIFMDYSAFFDRSFFDEEDPEFHVFFLNEAKVCIQRDFIGWTFDGKKYFFITELKIDDGYFNCMRWAIPGILLKENSLVLHSSCFVKKSRNEAYMFLGQSGAGKTTTVTSFSDEIILGDDMNVISFDADKIYVQSGAIGGQIYYPHFDQRFELKGLYWLRKNKTLNLFSVSREDARLRLMGSVANLFFGLEDDTYMNLAIDQIDRLAQLVPMYELQLMKGDNIWPILQPR